jgi:hypothetical protein
MNSKNNKNNTQNKKIKKIQRQTRKLRNIMRRKIRNIRKINKRRGINIAKTNYFKKNFKILNQTGNTMRVKGRDLIYSIPDGLENLSSTNIITIITANPAYWSGTRMAGIASAYQNYRPIKFHVHYVPQCAVTQQGNVIAGTLWNIAPNNTNLQQTLRTSNGGMLVQCYKNAVSKVQLGRNLQFNLFRMGGKFDQESNPFIFAAMTIATTDTNGNRINPGYFYLDYEYELKNPIGDTIKYYNSGLIQKKNYNGNYINETAIYCEKDKDINQLSILQLDNNQYSYHEQIVNVDEDDYIWYFNNMIKTNESGGEEEEQQITLNNLTKITTSTASVDVTKALLIISKFNNTALLIQNQSQNALSLNVINNDENISNYVGGSAYLSDSLEDYSSILYSDSRSVYSTISGVTINVA